MDDQESAFEVTVTYKRLKARKVTAWFSLIVILILSPILSFWLFDDLRYFFRFGQPTDLGIAEEMDQLSLKHNDYVRIEGVARDMCIRTERFFNPIKFLYLLGSETGARTVVETNASKNEPCTGAIESTFEGRLTHIEKNGKYQNVLKHYRTKFTSAPQEGVMYLLQDGTNPRSYWLIPTLFLVIFIVWIINIRTLWRFRKNHHNGGIL